jgi:uncharacterized linocin/CFP29 family protein
MPAGVDLTPATENLGRDKLDKWTREDLQKVDEAVCCEFERASIVSKFLPIYKPPSPSKQAVPAERIERPSTSPNGDSDGAVPATMIESLRAIVGSGSQNPSGNGALSIDQERWVPLIEGSIPFVLSNEQYLDEAKSGTAVTLAARAANALAQFMDLTVLQGPTALQGRGDIRVSPSQAREQIEQTGLLGAAQASNQVEQIELLEERTEDRMYGEHTFAAVSRAYARLQGRGFYGPYACVLHHTEFADTFAPLEDTLIMPADRIRPLMSAGFYGTGTLPEGKGLVVSVGGRALDLALAIPGLTAFSRIDEHGRYWFRVYARFTVRIKEPLALVLLDFQSEPSRARTRKRRPRNASPQKPRPQNTA